MRRLSKRSYHRICLILPLLIGVQTAVPQNFNSEVEAVIVTNDTKDDLLEITGIAKNLTEGSHSLRYELSVITSSSGNSSKNAQSGRFALGPFETKKLSTTAVSVSPTTKTIILLLLYDQDDLVVGTDRIVYNDKEAEKKLSFKKPNEGIILRGMVTEDTKTKPGKDFYDFFYQKYSLGPTQGNKIINIKEEISFGRTTRLSVEVDDKVVYQFFAKPKLDYLENQADIALKQVNRYFEYLRTTRDRITRY